MSASERTLPTSAPAARGTAGRAIASHTRTAGAAATALLLLALGACGGGGGGSATGSTGSDPTGGGDPPPAQVSESSLQTARPGALLEYFRPRLATRGFADSAALTPAASAGTAAAGFVSTTVQEAGVDEDDLLKTDGTHLYSLSRGASASLIAASRLQVHRRESGTGLTALASLPIASDASFTGLHLSADGSRIALVGARDPIAIAAIDPASGVASLPFVPQGPPSLQIEVIDVARPQSPVPLTRLRIDGRLTASRVIGNRLYLVSQWTPWLPALAAVTTEAQRTAALARLRTADLLPTLTVGDGAARALVDESQCLLQPANAAPTTELTTITVVDLANPGAIPSSRCFVGGTEAAYVSAASLYLATTRYAYSQDPRGIVYPAQVRTDIHKFALAEQGPQYRGSGSVPGHLGWESEKKPYRFGEYAGDLRVLTFTASTGWGPAAAASGGPQPSPATLSVLRENPSDLSLRVIASLPNAQRPAPLGLPEEQIYAVRFAGPRAYLVTFRRTDPLYILDLSNPLDPAAVGELKTAGYSDYLYPIGSDLLLGVGKDANEQGLIGGLKVALFDVSDPARVRELATRVYGRRGSVSALDSSRHGVSLFTEGKLTRVALPARLNLAANGFEPGPQGLLRWEIDSSARTLTERPMLPPAPSGSPKDPPIGFGQGDVGQERSVQIGEQLYYLNAAGLTGFDW